ncbi:hypothetical protein Tco_0248926, partial [Tanacetum coccineum]
TKRVVNKVDKGKDGSSGADDEGFIKVEKKKSGGVSLKTAPFVGKKHVWTSGNSSKTSGNSSKTSGNSSKTISKANVSTSSNGTFSLSNSFEALNVDDLVTEEVESGNKVSTSGVQEERQCSTPLWMMMWRETYGNNYYDPYDDD